jgi:hypothetical protein
MSIYIYIFFGGGGRIIEIKGNTEGHHTTVVVGRELQIPTRTMKLVSKVYKEDAVLFGR